MRHWKRSPEARYQDKELKDDKLLEYNELQDTQHIDAPYNLLYFKILLFKVWVDVL